MNHALIIIKDKIYRMKIITKDEPASPLLRPFLEFRCVRPIEGKVIPLVVFSNIIGYGRRAGIFILLIEEDMPSGDK